MLTYMYVCWKLFRWSSRIIRSWNNWSMRIPNTRATVLIIIAFRPAEILIFGWYFHFHGRNAAKFTALHKSGNRFFQNTSLAWRQIFHRLVQYLFMSRFDGVAKMSRVRSMRTNRLSRWSNIRIIQQEDRLLKDTHIKFYIDCPLCCFFFCRKR